jgi:uncharacterized protein
LRGFVARARAALGVLLLAVFAAAMAQVPVPELARRVTDLTATLSAEQVAALEARLAAFEARKGSQIAVLIVPTTQPEDIAQFGIRVADAWKIGRKKVDDGVILIVAKNDRKLRIEVGYGLEGVIPDAIAKRIISEIIAPRFAAGDFYGGIDAGVTALMQVIENEPLPAPAAQRAAAGAGDDTLVFLVFAGLIAGLILSALLGRILGGLVAGAGTAVAAALLSGVGILAIGVGMMVFLAVAFGRLGGGGWSSGGGFGGLGGGGSWGGGGGRFGGGGSSGSW